jgi:hypothetical protein
MASIGQCANHTIIGNMDKKEFGNLIQDLKIGRILTLAAYLDQLSAVPQSGN